MNASRPTHLVPKVACLVLVASGALALACSSRIGRDLTAPTPTAGQALTNLSPSAGPTYFEFQVEKPVRQAPNSAVPRYPEILKSAAVEGEVLASFVVDTTGFADSASFKVLRATHELFANAIRKAVPNMRFVPAEIRGRKVKQLVQQPFVFAIATPAGGSRKLLRPAAPNTVLRLPAATVTGVPAKRP